MPSTTGVAGQAIGVNMMMSRTSVRRRIGGAAALLLTVGAVGVSVTPAAAVDGDAWADILATKGDGTLWV